MRAASEAGAHPGGFPRDHLYRALDTGVEPAEEISPPVARVDQVMQRLNYRSIAEYVSRH
ncbi:MAG: hypothetical protein GEU77_03870 [Deltaproteobacteria bacterium]|nr:hypothetical protein [Deltaproteobacteria bacterium]